MTDTQHEIPEEPDLEAGEVIVEKPPRDWNTEAREMGWKPKDEWHGDPEGFRDAETFVKRGEEINGYIRRDRDHHRERADRAEAERDDRIRRLEEQNTVALKRQSEQHEAALKAISVNQRKAAEEGNLEEFDALVAKRDAMVPPPEIPQVRHSPNEDAVKEWAKDNPWFYNESGMRTMAEDIAGKVARSGGDVHAQCAAAEKEVRHRFPEKFEQPKAAVETAGGTPSRGKPKAKGVAELPKEGRDAFEKYVRMGVYKKDELPEYASKYWEQG